MSEAIEQPTIESPIVGPTDDEAIRESVRELNKQRAAEGRLMLEEPPVKRAYRADDESPKTLRQATADLSNAHRDESEEIQWASEASGVPPEQLRELAKDHDWVRQQRPDWNPAQVSEYVRSGAMPPERIGVASNDKKAHQPLDDMSPVIGERAHSKHATGNVREVTRAQQNFREAAALRQQQELAELEAQYSAQQAAQAEQRQPQAAQPEPQPTPQPQPQQPDPAQIERQRLEWEKRVTAELKQLSTGEMNAYVALNNLHAQWSAIPEVKDRNALNETYARNPQRYQQLQAAQREYQQRTATLNQEFQRHYQARTTREAQIAHAQTRETEAAVAAYNKENDDRFNGWFAKTFPKENLSEVSKYTRQAMLNAGVPDARINELWRSGALRGLETQQILAKAGLYEMQQARLQERRNELNSKKAPLPEVQRPGVARPRGSDSDADINRLEKQLEGASGDRAVKLAARLTRAKRSAGQL